jgi:hypothetical protein
VRYKQKPVALRQFAKKRSTFLCNACGFLKYAQFSHFQAISCAASMAARYQRLVKPRIVSSRGITSNLMASMSQQHKRAPLLLSSRNPNARSRSEKAA